MSAEADVFNFLRSADGATLPSSSPSRVLLRYNASNATLLVLDWNGSNLGMASPTDSIPRRAWHIVFYQNQVNEQMIVRNGSVIVSQARANSMLWDGPTGMFMGGHLDAYPTYAPKGHMGPMVVMPSYATSAQRKAIHNGIVEHAKLHGYGYGALARIP